MIVRTHIQGRKAIVATAMALVLAGPVSSRAQDTPAPATDPAPGAKPITLAEAISLAEKNAPRNGRGSRPDPVQLRPGALGYGAFLPGLNFSMGANRRLPSEGSRTVIGSGGQVEILPRMPWSYSFTTSANIGVFNGGRRINELRQARPARTRPRARNSWTGSAPIRRQGSLLRGARVTGKRRSPRRPRSTRPSSSSAPRSRA
jgi:hypothetical protein